MTEFRKNDRVKVVDASHRIVISRTPGARQLRRGEILTVATPSQKTPAGNITLVELPLSWKGSRFELVEHVVDEDKDGKPLYAGDRVTVVYPGGKHRECLVESTEEIGSWVTVYPVGGGIATNAPRSAVTLLRHHWEEPANSLATSMQNLGRVWAEYRCTEADRAAKALDAVAEAIQKAIDEADEIAKREQQAIAALPGGNGSIIRLTHRATGQPELHRIKAAWVDAETRKIWRDDEVANYSYEIIRDAQKEDR